MFAALMFIHELGHFIFAKRAGILVREFSLGLGPKLFSFKKGETQYSIRILPFGAYVRMAGEDPELTDIKTGDNVGLEFDQRGRVTDIYTEKGTYDIKLKVDDFDLEHDLFISGIAEDDREVMYKLTRETTIHSKKSKMQIAPWDRQFGSKSIRARFAAIIAGPIFNILLAVLIFFGVGMAFGEIGNYVRVDSVVENSPAAEAGIQVGDEIHGIDDKTYGSYQEILYEIQNSPGKELNIRVVRNGELQYIPIVPEEEEGRGRIGIKTGLVWVDISIKDAITSSLEQVAKTTVLIFDGFGQLITGKASMDDIAGPVGIMQISSVQAESGIAYFANWAAVLSLYLGIFNLLPIPALDGSRLMFLTLEGLRGKPVDPKRESAIHLIGFAFLMLLMVVVTINDISRFFN